MKVADGCGVGHDERPSRWGPERWPAGEKLGRKGARSLNTGETIGIMRLYNDPRVDRRKSKSSLSILVDTPLFGQSQSGSAASETLSLGAGRYR